MSEMIVSWKYAINDDKGLEKFYLFSCIDLIKLELNYQVFQHFMKSKDPKKELERKFRIVMIKDGKVDLSKFEIEIRNSKKIFKVFRDENEKPNKR